MVWCNEGYDKGQYPNIVSFLCKKNVSVYVMDQNNSWSAIIQIVGCIESWRSDYELKACNLKYKGFIYESLLLYSPLYEMKPTECKGKMTPFGIGTCKLHIFTNDILFGCNKHPCFCKTILHIMLSVKLSSI